MHMVAVGSDLKKRDLKKRDLMAQGNLQADFPEGCVYIGVEDGPSISRAADQLEPQTS